MIKEILEIFDMKGEKVIFKKIPEGGYFRVEGECPKCHRKIKLPQSELSDKSANDLIARYTGTKCDCRLEDKEAQLIKNQNTAISQELTNIRKEK